MQRCRFVRCPAQLHSAAESAFATAPFPFAKLEECSEVYTKRRQASAQAAGTQPQRLGPRAHSPHLHKQLYVKTLLYCFNTVLL